QPRRSSGRRGADMVGFGGDVAVALAPVVLVVVGEVLVHLRQELARAAARGVADAIDERVRGLFRRSPAAVPVPPLTTDQLAEVRRLAFEKARAMRLSEVRAHLLADALVGSLVPAPRA